MVEKHWTVLQENCLQLQMLCDKAVGFPRSCCTSFLLSLLRSLAAEVTKLGDHLFLIGSNGDVASHYGEWASETRN